MDIGEHLPTHPMLTYSEMFLLSQCSSDTDRNNTTAVKRQPGVFINAVSAAWEEGASIGHHAIIDKLNHFGERQC